MTRFRIDLTGTAKRQLRRIDIQHQRRLATAIDALATDPFPPGVKRLISSNALWRIRVGDYRVIYEVHQAEIRLLVVRIAHRKDVYRDL